jgi:hypothetical protein
MRSVAVVQANSLREYSSCNPPLSIPANEVDFAYTKTQPGEQGWRYRPWDFINNAGAPDADQQQQKWTLGTLRSHPFDG